MKFFEKEKQMFMELGFDDNTLHRMEENMSAYDAYECAVKKVFVQELKGKAVDSLRQCLMVLEDGEAYRGTPEFDELIQLD